MSRGRSRSLPEYSVLVQRTVLFWERVEVQAKTPEDAADLAEEKVGSYDWSNCQELEVAVSVEKEGEVLAEVEYEH